MITFRYAKIDDVTFISQTQRLHEVKNFVSSSSDEEISARITDPNQVYILALRNNCLPVGFVHLRQIKSSERSIEIHQLAMTERNKGYGCLFMKLIITEVFGVLNANRLWLDVFPENTRARNVYLQSGFTEEGTLRDAYYWNGAYQSTTIMSLLAREFEAE